MKTNKQELETLKDIRNMMERSSRFVSLSGWSGVSAGICALTGAFFAWRIVHNKGDFSYTFNENEIRTFLCIAILTFIAAFVSATFFTYLKSKSKNVPLWGLTSKRLMWSVAIPMIAGGLLILRLVELGLFGLAAPASLIIYGITVFSASKQTYEEIKYLAYGEILLGITGLWHMGYGLLLWTIGFGLFHILYGIYMWFKYERK